MIDRDSVQYDEANDNQADEEDDEDDDDVPSADLS